MAKEDHILNQDPFNFNDEIEYKIFYGEITLKDLIELYKDDYIDSETLTNSIEYAQYLKDGSDKYNNKALSLETKKLLHQAKQILLKGGITAKEDHILNQDPFNFNDEIEYKIFCGEITIKDLIELYKDDYIDSETLMNNIEYAQYLQDGADKYNNKALSLETKKLLHQAKQSKAITNKKLDD